MRYFLFALFFALAGCTGGGMMYKQVDISRNAPIYIAPIESDDYEIAPRLALFLGRKGFDVVKDEDARYRMKAGYSRTRTRIEVFVMVIDTATGEKIYAGEAVNPGFGTASLFGKSDVIWGSFETALQGFR